MATEPYVLALMRCVQWQWSAACIHMHVHCTRENQSSVLCEHGLNYSGRSNKNVWIWLDSTGKQGGLEIRRDMWT